MEFHADSCAALFDGDCTCGASPEAVWEIRLAREQWAAGDFDHMMGRIERDEAPARIHDVEVDPEIPF